jgi:hypothetical protein
VIRTKTLSHETKGDGNRFNPGNTPMKSTNYAIRIIPDLTIDDKYGGIIEEAQKRIRSFTENALNGGRLGELFILERSGLDGEMAARILRAGGRLLAGFQFEARTDLSDNNFKVFVRKLIKDKRFKFYLNPEVQEILLQLISLEDRRTIAIFSMLNSSLDVGYRILTTLYGNQLKRLVEKAAPFARESMVAKLEKLKFARSEEEEDIWKNDGANLAGGQQAPQGNRPGSQDNILQVIADETLSDEVNQYVENLLSKTERIREKRRQLEENKDMPRAEIYEQMVREDLNQLENCYARIHIYLRAFYKNKARRNNMQNGILRQFFGGEIEGITAETSLLEDLLSLNEQEYFRNLDRHKEL